MLIQEAIKNYKFFRMKDTNFWITVNEYGQLICLLNDGGFLKVALDYTAILADDWEGKE